MTAPAADPATGTITEVDRPTTGRSAPPARPRVTWMLGRGPRPGCHIGGSRPVKEVGPSGGVDVATDDHELLAEHFEAHRARMRALATRMLGSASDADEAVQETWIRLQRTDTGDVDNLGGWLTTVLSRVCLNILQARRSRPELAPEVDVVDAAERVSPPLEASVDEPGDELVLAESIGLALLVVLDTLSAGERVALVLHDIFGVPFDDIAPIIDRSPAATRQLASRARRRVRGGEAVTEDRVRRAALVDAFLGAARRGDFEGLVAMLDPDVMMTADAVAAGFGVAAEVRGASEVGAFARRFQGLVPALADGDAAAAWVQRGSVRVVIRFAARDEQIDGIRLIADPAAVAAIDLVLLDPSADDGRDRRRDGSASDEPPVPPPHQEIPMTVPTRCANCDAPLLADQPAGSSYCATCTAAWTRVRGADGDGDGEAGSPSPKQCANCKAPLPADQPADSSYCPTCTAAWTRG